MPIKTGLYGGSFNPIHKGHVHLARQLLRTLHLDEVWFLVSPQNPLKVESDLAPEQVRLELARLALRRYKRLNASDYEFHLPRPSYTWNTLQALSKDYPDREFILLIGGDNWLRFPKWYRHDDILKNYRIAIYPRTDNEIDPDTLPPNVTMMNAETIDVSSTEIRQRLQEGRSVSGLVTTSVERVLLKEKVYRKK